MMSDLQRLGEFGWIERQSRSLAVRAGVRLGIGDDCAVLDALQTPVVTCDCLVEEIHFRRDWSSPRQLGRKSLSVSVSDVAAMGARPVAAFVSLALPREIGLSFLDEFYCGLEEIAAHFSFTVAGGDTSRSPRGLMINVALVGEAAANEAAASGELPKEQTLPLLRSGARANDVLLVTGTLGDSAAGLWLLQNPQTVVAPSSTEFLLRRHLDPQARCEEMQAALQIGGVHAAIDLSDGLAGDAAHIARRSALALEIETAGLPFSTACREVAKVAQTAQTVSKSSANLNAQSAVSETSTANRVLDAAQNWALSGGEDYELLLCVAPEKAEAIARHIENETQTQVTQIGRCVASPKPRVKLLNGEGAEIVVPEAWTHF